ncbi:MAG: YdeI/OmpD-associated family protein [Chloroflexota bacterium]|nr:YdeI/OmpD-associated family protein [Chloroflexota bacterium]
MEVPTATVFATPAEFRRWLEEHHDRETELWIGYYRKGVPKTSMTYPEAVEEALCFGWIDGVGRRIDDEVSANRFTPRTKRSSWSAVNVARMGELIAAGRVHPAGLRAFEARTADNTGIYSYENRPADLPDAYLARLCENEAAWSWWQAQTPGYRRGATWWVVSAKQETTRDRRLATLIEDCAAGRLIKPMRYGRHAGSG